MAVEGVSGEIATPAFMFFSWMVLMREMASAGRVPGVRILAADFGSMSILTGCLYVKTVEFTASICDSVNPLRERVP